MLAAATNIVIPDIHAAPMAWIIVLAIVLGALAALAWLVARFMR
jgi:hypothetical protein